MLVLACYSSQGVEQAPQARVGMAAVGQLPGQSDYLEVDDRRPLECLEAAAAKMRMKLP